MYPKSGSCWFIEVSPSTVSIDKNGLQNTVSLDWAPLQETPTNAHELFDSAQDGNRDADNAQSDM